MSDEKKPVSSASPMAVATAVSTDDEAVVASYDTVLEAELARGRLESEGIGARILDGNTVGVAQHLSLALGGVKIAVARSDFEAAVAILTAKPDETDEEEEDDEDEPSKQELVKLDADATANRALRSAVLGLVFFPPLGQLWSLYLLSQVKRAELTTKGWRQGSIALVIDGGVIAFAAWVIAQIAR